MASDGSVLTYNSSDALQTTCLTTWGITYCDVAADNTATITDETGQIATCAAPDANNSDQVVCTYTAGNVLTTQTDLSYVLTDTDGTTMIETCAAPDANAGTITCTTDTNGNELVIQIADGSSVESDAQQVTVETCSYSAGGIRTCVAA
jgi:hypothetical protein